MISALVEGILIVGLESKNIELLKKGKPFRLDLVKMPPHNETVPIKQVVVFFGDTPEDLLEQLSPMIGPDTQIRDYRKDS